MPIREYQRPKDLPAAQAALRQPGATPLMFGPRLPDEPFAGVDVAVDLSQLNLNYIREEDDTIHIGALTLLQEVVTSPLVRNVANGILSEAAQLAAGLGLRHLATVGGALQAKDGPPEMRLALNALKASVVLLSPGSGQLAINLDSNWEKAQPAEILLEIVVGRRARGFGGALERVARSPRDEAIVAAVALVEFEKGAFSQAHVRVGPSPRCGASVAAMSGGQKALDEITLTVLQHLETSQDLKADYRGSVEYRKAMAGVLARRALTKAWERATVH